MILIFTWAQGLYDTGMPVWTCLHYIVTTHSTSCLKWNRLYMFLSTWLSLDGKWQVKTEYQKRSQMLMIKHSETILFSYLHISLLCGSWNHKRILKKKPFWKYDGWFCSEESNFTSVRNMLYLSLKYWFMNTKNVFWIFYGPKK